MVGNVSSRIIIIIYCNHQCKVPLLLYMCLISLSRFYSVLMFGRFLSGVATALLFHTFESWYLHEHIDTHAFPGEWIPITFSKVGLFNSILAIGAGLIGNISAEWIGLGPVAPFIIAIPCFVASGYYRIYIYTL